MTPPPPPGAEVTLATDVALPASMAAPAPAVPRYLQKVYWWAYVHPRAVAVFEREWLVNAILFGNYARLRDAALADLGAPTQGRTLQIACVYGNLTPRLVRQLDAKASLDVVDILPIQLDNLKAKLPADQSQVALLRGNSAALPGGAAQYDQVLLFFLLHEQPERVRRATLAEAMRVVKPGGKVVIVDYHKPRAWHPLRLLMTGVFRRLEPYAIDLWRNEVTDFIAPEAQPVKLEKRTYFGGLYQKLVLTR